MHRLSLIQAAAFIDAAASSAMSALSLGSPALLVAARLPGPRPPPWLRFGGGGARRGMLCSAEAARRGGDEEAEEERRVGRAAAERGLRGGNAAASGSVELRAIPGVGPRNLRKLVDKGFEGVAQLKQLYRDKVCVLFVCQSTFLCIK
jgi:hypothetical protein